MIRELAEASIDAFGKTERSMLRVQHETGATTAELRGMREEIWDIAARAPGVLGQARDERVAPAYEARPTTRRRGKRTESK